MSDDESGAVIFHNNRMKILRSDCEELHSNRTRCCRCKIIVERVRNLLEEVIHLRDYDTIDVCKHCKRAKTTRQCRKCDSVFSKFLFEHGTMIERRQKSFNAWLLKVKSLLQEIRNTHQEYEYVFYRDSEFEKILKQLVKPLSMRIPNIDYFPHVAHKNITEVLAENKEILSDILKRINSDCKNKCFNSELTLFPSTSKQRTCICKPLQADQHLEKEFATMIKTLPNNDFKNENVLLQRLIDLQNEINIGTYDVIDKRLLDLLGCSLDNVIRHGLSSEHSEILLKQLIELNTTLCFVQIRSDFDVYDLILDLEKCLVKDISKEMLHNLADLTEYLAKQVSEDVKIEISPDLYKKEMRESMACLESIGIDIKIDECQKLEENHLKEIASKLLDLNKALKQDPFSDAKVHGISKKKKCLVETGVCNDFKILMEKLCDIFTVLSKRKPPRIDMSNVQELVLNINNFKQQGSCTGQNRQLLCRQLEKLYNKFSTTSYEEKRKVMLSGSTNSDINNLCLCGDDTYKEASLFYNATESRKTVVKTETEVMNMRIEKDAKNAKNVMKNVMDINKNVKVAKKYQKSSENIKSGRKSIYILQMIKKSTTTHERSKLKKVSKQMKVKAPASLPDLPQTRSQKSASTFDSLDSFIVCDNERGPPKYFVQGTSLKPYHKYKKERTLPPLDIKQKGSKSEPRSTVLRKDSEKIESDISDENKEASGVIKYQLSNTEFIAKGWTILPTKKVMRRINIYKMEPVEQKNKWLEKLQNEKKMYYNTGEIFSEIDEFGGGRWYYKNGSLALEYYNAEEMYAGRRFIVYSSDVEYLNKHRARTILAIFDYLGNGIIYDLNGNIRLKYNQTEGKVIDPKIGPPCRWMWHTLNEPPVIEEVFKELIERQHIINSESSLTIKTNHSKSPECEDPMLQIELHNEVKAKLKNMSQNFQSHKIKMKVAKLNNNFSVRVLDQSNIRLVYREGNINLQLNLGMKLNNREIIDSQIFEIGDVFTPYDNYPAPSQSVENIQQTLHNVRKRNKKLADRKVYLV